MLQRRLCPAGAEQEKGYLHTGSNQNRRCPTIHISYWIIHQASRLSQYRIRMQPTGR